MKTREIDCQMKGYSLLLAEILQRLPDCARILQSYIRQAYDLALGIPELQKFLDCKDQKPDANAHSE